MNNRLTGTVFDIKRFAIHDGPGIRTTVFLKGCPLRCMWCHNPESQKMEMEISFMPDKCIGCDWCFDVCPQNCHRMEDDKHIFDRIKCIVCGKCTEKCYARAIEVIGKKTSVAEVIAEAMKDKTFYDNSGGGVTISGGEPMMQFKFTKALLKEAKNNGLHTCLDTCGFTQFEKYEKILKDIDIFLYDLKGTDTALHKKHTGVELDLILENLQKLDDAGAKIYLRCPVIPELNVNSEHIEGIIQIASKLKNLEEIDLMPYHPLGEAKQKHLGLDSKLNSKGFADRYECEKLRSLLEACCNVSVNMD